LKHGVNVTERQRFRDSARQKIPVYWEFSTGSYAVYALAGWCVDCSWC